MIPLSDIRFVSTSWPRVPDDVTRYVRFEYGDGGSDWFLADFGANGDHNGADVAGRAGGGPAVEPGVWARIRSWMGRRPGPQRNRDDADVTGP